MVAFLFEFYNGIRGLGDYAIASLEHEYQKTNIYINLGDNSKKFITPRLPKEFKNYLTYHFKKLSKKITFTLLMAKLCHRIKRIRKLVLV